MTWNKLSFSTQYQQPQRRNSKSYSRHVSWVNIAKMFIDLFTKSLQKKQSQDTSTKFIKILLKFLSESYTDKIIYIYLIRGWQTTWNTTLLKIIIPYDYTTEKLKPYDAVFWEANFLTEILKIRHLLLIMKKKKKKGTTLNASYFEKVMSQ